MKTKLHVTFQMKQQQYGGEIKGKMGEKETENGKIRRETKKRSKTNINNKYSFYEPE